MITATLTTDNGRKLSRTFTEPARAERWILSALGANDYDLSIFCHGVTFDSDTGEMEEYEY